jgi:hypothetical protein
LRFPRKPISAPPFFSHSRFFPKIKPNYEISRLAATRKVTLAHSTPCFEFWLLLHIVGFTTRADLVDGTKAKSAVKDALGRDYSTDEKTAQEAIATFIKKWHQAVVHAEQVREHHHPKIRS